MLNFNSPAAAETFTTLGYIAKDFGVLAADVAKSDEAIALYCKALTVTRDAGVSLRKLSEQAALDIAHGIAFFATLAVWGLFLLWELGRCELQREVVAFRSALVQAVQDARSYELPLSALAEASESISFDWPERGGALVLAQPTPALISLQFALGWLAWVAEDGAAS